MLTDFDFAPTHERADYCDAADEATTPSPVSEEEITAWENNPWF
jgi:hypothetical protein